MMEFLHKVAAFFLVKASCLCPTDIAGNEILTLSIEMSIWIKVKSLNTYKIIITLNIFSLNQYCTVTSKHKFLSIHETSQNVTISYLNIEICLRTKQCNVTCVCVCVNLSWCNAAHKIE
jgi:hypothetical protein